MEWIRKRRQSVPRKKVLVADDEPHVVTLLKYWLEESGCVVMTADSVTNAIQTIREDPPDLVLLDYLWFDCDGFEAIEALRREPGMANVPVILLPAGFADADTPRSGHLTHRGMSIPHLQKPFLPDALFALMDRLFGYRSANDQAENAEPERVMEGETQ